MNQSLMNFYNENKDKTFVLPPLPDLPLEEQAEWILANSNFGWIKLDIEFNADIWKVQALEAEPFYQGYKGNDTQGWASCCIHGFDVDKVLPASHYGLDEFTDKHDYTKLADKTPVITDFWKNQFPHSRYTRIRFMKLSAGGYIDSHNDGEVPAQISRLDYIIPVNLAISHPVNCEFVVEGCGTVPWHSGDIYLIDVTKNHCVINHSSKDRIHMIAYILLDSDKQAFSELLVRSYKKML